jgi:hypothetical protein
MSSSRAGPMTGAVFGSCRKRTSARRLFEHQVNYWSFTVNLYRGNNLGHNVRNYSRRAKDEPYN